MPQESVVFPIHIRAEYDAANRPFMRFEAEVDNVTATTEKMFLNTGREINQIVKNALTLPRNALGSLDLDSGRFRTAANDAEDFAQSLRQVENAARRLAKETGDTTEETRLYLQAANAATKEAEKRAGALSEQATVYEKLQRAVNETTATTQRQIGIQQRGIATTNAATKSTRAQRFAMVQVGQQFQDVAIQLQTNTRLSTIFVQQGSQLAFAMSGLSGKVGSVARVLAGPLGAGIAGAVTAFSLLRSTTDDNAEASNRAQQAGEELARSQLDIAKFFDLATGKIKEQNKALIANAVAKRKELSFNLKDKIKEDTETFIGTSVASVSRRADSRSPTGFVQSLDVLNALKSKDREKALADLSLSDSVNANLAKKLSDRLATIADTGDRIRELNREIKSLETGTLDVGLRTGSLKTPNGGRSAERAAKAAAREVERLSAVSNQTAEAIARINAQFDDQPRLVDRSAAAIRKLDDLAKELAADKNIDAPRRSELQAEQQRVRALVEESISNEIGKQIERSEEGLRIQTLLVQGKEEEAEIAQRMGQFENRFGLQSKIKEQRETLGVQQSILETSEKGTEERAKAEQIIDETRKSLTENLKNQNEINDAVRSQVAAEERLNDLAQIRQEQLGRYAQTIGTVRGELESLFAGDGSGFFSNIKNSFRDLQAQTSVEAIFGDAFRDLEKALRRNTPLGRAETALGTAMGRTGDIALDLGNDLVTVSELVRQKVIPALSPDPLEGRATRNLGTPANDVNGVIPVTGRRIEAVLGVATITQFSNGLSEALTIPILAKFDEVFGTRFFSQLSEALSGALAGYLTAGPVGGVLGGLEQVIGDLTSKGGINEALGAKLSAGLGEALKGAQTGTQTALLLEGLGIKSSTTGGQIGGAIGSALPIPGGEIIGSILGSVVGGALQSTKRGSATLGIGLDGRFDIGSTRGNSSSRIQQSESLLGDAITQVERIAEGLGGRLNTSLGSVSLGVRKGNIRLDASGRGITKTKNGAIDFGEDANAAVQAAVFDLIQDGVIVGLRRGSEVLLKNARDLEAGLADALAFEDVFRRLEQRRDPLGAAFRTLNTEFEGLIDLFERAGASAEEFADLEELYTLERADLIKQASEDFTSSLQSFLDDLKIGDNGLSVRDRLGAALDRFNPLAADVRAGNTVDSAQFEEAARAVLELERQVFGSQGNYFSRLDEITALTERTLQTEQDRLTAASNDNSALQFEIQDQTATLSGYLEAINRGNNEILQAIRAGGGGFGLSFGGFPQGGF
ncbi:MAG: phage tail length tape measure family protein [Pseudomonadota bacterium]